MRTLTTLLVSFAALLVLPAPGRSQAVYVGGFAGGVGSRLLQTRGDDSSRRTGPVAGVFVEVQTPAPYFSVLGEAGYARRGARFVLEGLAGQEGDVQVDYLTATIAPTFRMGVGSMALFAYGGPTLELGARTRAHSELQTAFANPSAQVFAVTAGAGVEFRTAEWSVKGEARVVEELSAAFKNGGTDFRYRSTEVVVRVARRSRN